MWWWLWSSGALAADCDPNDAVRRALQAWLGGDHPAARVALADAERAYGCSPGADPQTLARYRILEGVSLTDEGDRESAAESFAAARRIAPDMWLPDLAPAFRDAWSQARDPQGAGVIVLEPVAGDRPVWVDGTKLVGTEVPVGLHLVQVGTADGAAAAFATTVWVGPGVATVVETRLPAAPAVVKGPEPIGPVPVAVVPIANPVPEPARPPRELTTRFEIHGLVGESTAIGTALTDGDRREPGVKIAVPLELGLGVAGHTGFVRAQVGGAVLVGGQYLASKADGAPVALPVRVDLGVAAGLGDEVRVGLAGGVQWPSRLAGRVLVGWSPVEVLYGELRLGANVPTERSPEPAGELLVGFRL